MTNAFIGQTVNVAFYIDISGSDVVEVATQYQMKKKKEVVAFDNSHEGLMKVTL